MKRFKNKEEMRAYMEAGNKIKVDDPNEYGASTLYWVQGEEPKSFFSSSNTRDMNANRTDTVDHMVSCLWEKRKYIDYDSMEYGIVD